MEAQLQKVYLLVMGLTGAGKSTFIFRATGDTSIVIGEGLESVTQDTAEYIVIYKGFEVHLIDTPGFDDNGSDDARILKDIANRINFIYKDGVRISGVLYLHDITKARIGGSGVRNIRLLEELLGVDHWDGCTLITTKWGHTTTPELEQFRESQLEDNGKFWKAMRTSTRRAEMKRFGNTQESALQIIDPYLKEGFVPQLTYEMVHPAGPKHALGETRAGQQISEYLNQLEKQKGKTAQTEEARLVLQEKFNEILYRDYQTEKRRMIEHQKWKQGGRWALRLVTLGGCIAGTVVTLGAASPAFAAVPLVEVWAQGQKQDYKQKMIDLTKQYHLDLRDAKLGISSESLNRKGFGKVHGGDSGRPSSDSGQSSTSSYCVRPEGYRSSSEESLLFKSREDGH